MKHFLATALTLATLLSTPVEAKRRAVGPPPLRPSHVVAHMAQTDDLTVTNHSQYPTTLRACAAEKCINDSLSPGETAAYQDLIQNLSAQPGPVVVTTGAETEVRATLGDAQRISDAAPVTVIPTSNRSFPTNLMIYTPNAGEVKVELLGGNGIYEDSRIIAAQKGVNIFNALDMPGYNLGKQVKISGVPHLAAATVTLPTQTGGTTVTVPRVAKDVTKGSLEHYILFPTSDMNRMIVKNTDRGTINVQATPYPTGTSTPFTIMPDGISTIETAAGPTVYSTNSPSIAWSDEYTANSNDFAGKEALSFNVPGVLRILSKTNQKITVVDGQSREYDLTANTVRDVQTSGKSMVIGDVLAVLDSYTSGSGITHGPYRTSRPAVAPRIIGVDYNNDGVVDNPDANGDGVADRIVGVDCGAPFPLTGKLTVSTPGQYTFFVSNPPQGLSFNQGTGEYSYTAPCTSAGGLYTPTFSFSGNDQVPFTVRFRVN